MKDVDFAEFLQSNQIDGFFSFLYSVSGMKFELKISCGNFNLKICFFDIILHVSPAQPTLLLKQTCEITSEELDLLHFH